MSQFLLGVLMDSRLSLSRASRFGGPGAAWHSRPWIALAAPASCRSPWSPAPAFGSASYAAAAFYDSSGSWFQILPFFIRSDMDIEPGLHRSWWSGRAVFELIRSALDTLDFCPVSTMPALWCTDGVLIIAFYFARRPFPSPFAM